MHISEHWVVRDMLFFRSGRALRGYNVFWGFFDKEGLWFFPSLYDFHDLTISLLSSHFWWKLCMIRFEALVLLHSHRFNCFNCFSALFVFWKGEEVHSRGLKTFNIAIRSVGDGLRRSKTVLLRLEELSFEMLWSVLRSASFDTDESVVLHKTFWSEQLSTIAFITSSLSSFFTCSVLSASPFFWFYFTLLSIIFIKDLCFTLRATLVLVILLPYGDVSN